MSHSHVPIRHLLKQLETWSGARTARNARPAWIDGFVEEITDLFEPYEDLGRVGFDCQLTDDGWAIGMYLGSTEHIGGRDDGRFTFASFRLNVTALTQRFSHIDDFQWDVVHVPLDADDQPHAALTIRGTVGEESLTLRVFSVPPATAGPGFRRLPDGTLNAV